MLQEQLDLEKKEAIKAAERDLEHGKKAYKNKAAEKKQRLSEQLEERFRRQTGRKAKPLHLARPS